jgi:hypothetical protein
MSENRVDDEDEFIPHVGCIPSFQKALKKRKKPIERLKKRGEPEPLRQWNVLKERVAMLLSGTVAIWPALSASFAAWFSSEVQRLNNGSKISD